MTAQNDCNYVQKIFYIIFRKYLPNWSDVVSFSNRTGISQNTLRDIYYKDGQAGIATMDRVLKELLELTPEKVDSIVHRIHVVEPIPESARIWNSINVPESRKRYYALVAKALSEIDEKLESKN